MCGTCQVHYNTETGNITVTEFFHNLLCTNIHYHDTWHLLAEDIRYSETITVL